MISNLERSLKNPESNLRLFLDVPYRYGIENIKIAFNSQNKLPPFITDAIRIEPSKKNVLYTLISLKHRVTYLVVGIFECIPLVGIIVAYVDRYFRSLSKSDHLIKSTLPIPSHQYFWYLNLALLRSAYDKAEGPQKKQIEFLAANFLNKVTPKLLEKWISEVKSVDSNYKTPHIASPIDEYSYHRENLDHHCMYGGPFNDQLAYVKKSLLLLTDTIELDPLLSLWFTLINKKGSLGEYQELLYKNLSHHFETIKDSPWNKNFSKPFVVDVTNILEASIHTQKNSKKEKAFQKCFESFKRTFEEAEQKAVEQLIQAKPHLAQHKTSILSLLKKNTSCIYRVKTDDYTGIKLLPMGPYTSLNNQYNSPILHLITTNGDCLNFITHAGLYINAIGLRKMIANVFNQRPDVKYLIDSKMSSSQLTSLYYPSKELFINSRSFQRIGCLFQCQELKEKDPTLYGIDIPQLKERIAYMQNRPHMLTMGKLTIDLLQGLMHEITDAKWEQIHKDPILLQIFQTSLFLIQQHLSTAEQSALANKFDQFMERIELVHAELATLLELTRPFTKEDFNEVYKKALLGKSIPSDLKAEVRCGLGKSATNVFAGISMAATPPDGSLKSVAGKESYYEHKILTNDPFDDFMKNPAAPKAHLYHAQFYPNVNVSADPIEYQKKDIASDIRKLLSENKMADHFTVAIDLTIDDFYSDAVKELLQEFTAEIASGKINFALFASGQKFYNLGMDHYYGAPFYIVNNGDKKWSSFDALFSHPLYNPDHLSIQWFNLVTKYASDSIQNYRTLIFNNTKTILKQVPESLKHDLKKTQTLRISNIKDNMKPPFIDLKLVAPKEKQEAASRVLKRRFLKLIRQENMDACTRGSFGFFHCNFSVFGHLDDRARVIRINPGINPDENGKLLHFLQEISST